MDFATLVELMHGTTVYQQRASAEARLNELSPVAGFSPMLLQIMVSDDVATVVKQATAIYMKNLILRHWQDKEPNKHGSSSLLFSIPEQDRQLIRNSIIEATCRPCDEVLLNQLALCVSTIVKYDFPDRWPQIVDKISFYMQSQNSAHYHGILITLYQLVKNYEYSTRAPLLEAMKHILPLMYQFMLNIINGMDKDSIILQKRILKIYFTLVQYAMPLELITKEVFAQWMEILRVCAAKIPLEYPVTMDDEEKSDLPIWKLKKWAVRTLHRLFYRYGSPGNVTDTYTEFAEWYLTTFSGGILDVVLGLLHQYRNKCFVSPSVLQHSLNYVTQSVSHSHSWKFLKPHMFGIIQHVIFPIMSHNLANEEMLVSDPKSYLRMKTDMFDEYLIPMPSAKALLIHCCKKRKDLLLQTMEFCLFVLNSENYGNYDKDGAMHVVGSLADVLLNKNNYKPKIEEILIKHAIPAFSTNNFEHMRARGCWILHNFSGAKLNNEQLLAETMRLIIETILRDDSMPVKFEAAIGLQNFLTEEPGVQKYVVQQVHLITIKLLHLLRETENDDLTAVVQKLLCSFAQQLMPVAVEITDHLVDSFIHIFEEFPSSDERAITSMALLNTIDRVMMLMSDNDEVIRGMQPKVLYIISHIFKTGVTDFYEEAFSLIYNLTSKSITPELWKVLGDIYDIFQKSGQEYFIDMMPALHNYVTVDTPAFVSNQNHVLAIFNMCREILTGKYEEDPECHAAKMLEVIILNCKGQINQAVPCFVALVLERLTRDVKTSELRVMCLQVVIAAIYYDAMFLLNILREICVANPTGSAAPQFMEQWLSDIDCFFGIHDRKLSIIGFCILLDLEPCHRDPLFGDNVSKILPACLLLFDGLKKSYVTRDALEEEVESECSEEADRQEEYKVLNSDEDEVDEELLREKIKEARLDLNIPDNGDDSDYDEDYSATETTPLETYDTILDKNESTVDEYILFYDVLAHIFITYPAFYEELTKNLQDNDKKILNDVCDIASKKRQDKLADGNFAPGLNLTFM